MHKLYISWPTASISAEKPDSTACRAKIWMWCKGSSLYTEVFVLQGTKYLDPYLDTPSHSIVEAYSS